MIRHPKKKLDRQIKQRKRNSLIFCENDYTIHYFPNFKEEKFSQAVKDEKIGYWRIANLKTREEYDLADEICRELSGLDICETEITNYTLFTQQEHAECRFYIREKDIDKSKIILRRLFKSGLWEKKNERLPNLRLVVDNKDRHKDVKIKASDYIDLKTGRIVETK